LVSVYISGELKVYAPSGKTAFTKQTESIKGVGYSIEEAKNKAFDDFLTSLNRKYFKQAFEAIQ